jgi:two-component system, NtrC family, response regulator HydG
VEEILKPMAKEMARPKAKVSASAMKKLMAYSWPGNVRELRNVLERALLTLHGNEIRSEDLVIERAGGSAVARKSGAVPSEEWEIQPLDKVVTEYVTAAVEAAGGNMRKAARQLQISPSTLYARLKEPATKPDS